jgi:transcriptional regulator with XRE-family HTH domain
MSHTAQPAPALTAPALVAQGRLLGAVVRGARTAQGLTLAELGRRTGYSAAQVSRYERGLAPLTDIAVLRRFADALQIAPQILGLAPAADRAPRQSGAHGPGNGSPKPGTAGESVKPYADRGLVTREQWNGIIHGATRDCSTRHRPNPSRSTGTRATHPAPSLPARKRRWPGSP